MGVPLAALPIGWKICFLIVNKGHRFACWIIMTVREGNKVKAIGKRNLGRMINLGFDTL